MKPISRTIFLCLFPFAMLHAQEAPAPKPELRPYQQEFSNLPLKQREDFSKKFTEGQRLFNEKRVFEALEKVNEAEAIFADSPELLTLRGACDVEFRNFEKAMESFVKADKLIPGQQSILFNIAELNFVTKDWAAAETSLAKVLAMVPAKPSANDLQLSRLVEFKLLLSKLKLGKKEEAAKMAVKYDYLDDSPYPYYAEAAIHFSEGREIEAEAAMARGGRIFQNPGILAPWQDTMIEFGYIKGFFGGDAEAPAVAPVE
jgi:tetratricopeptide (TPR) repeat protein